MSKRVSKELLALIGDETNPEAIVRIVNKYNEQKAAEAQRLRDMKEFLRILGANKKLTVDNVKDYAYEYATMVRSEFKHWLELNHDELYAKPTNKKKEAQPAEQNGDENDTHATEQNGDENDTQVKPQAGATDVEIDVDNFPKENDC